MADVKITPERQRFIDFWALEDENERLLAANRVLTTANTELNELVRDLRAALARERDRLPSAQHIAGYVDGGREGSDG